MHGKDDGYPPSLAIHAYRILMSLFFLHPASGSFISQERFT